MERPEWTFGPTQYFSTNEVFNYSVHYLGAGVNQQESSQDQEAVVWRNKKPRLFHGPPSHTLHSLLLGLSTEFHWATLHWCAHWIQMLIAHPHHISSSFFPPIALSWKKKFSFKKWIWFLVKNTQFGYQKLAWVQLFPVCTRNRLHEWPSW